MNEPPEPYWFFLLKTLPGGIIGAILVAICQRWIKARGRIDVRINLEFFNYKRNDSYGSLTACDPKQAQCAEYSFRLYAFSYKESATAFSSLQVVFRQDRKELFRQHPKDADGHNVKCLELPSRIPIDLDLKGFTQYRSPETKLVTQADSIYLETVDAEGKRRDYLIARINPPDSIP